MTITNKNPWTPMHLASLKGHAEVVEILLESGVAAEKDTCGRTALFFAAQRGHVQVVQTLLASGRMH